MIFFLVMPGLFGGFGNYFIPIYIGSSEIIYPRINNFSILILFLSYLLIILSIILEFGSGTGWTLYPPLSTSFMNLSPSSIIYIIIGLLISGISSCLTSINFYITILNMRSYYIILNIISLFLWSLLITGAMLLLTLPILSGALIIIYLLFSFLWILYLLSFALQSCIYLYGTDIHLFLFYFRELLIYYCIIYNVL